jgi:hypothetical protein
LPGTTLAPGSLRRQLADRANIHYPTLNSVWVAADVACAVGEKLDKLLAKVDPDLAVVAPQLGFAGGEIGALWEQI